jgi:hypothetical protein
LDQPVLIRLESFANEVFGLQSRKLNENTGNSGKYLLYKPIFVQFEDKKNGFVCQEILSKDLPNKTVI